VSWVDLTADLRAAKRAESTAAWKVVSWVERMAA
jgi:hypothetical protein